MLQKKLNELQYTAIQIIPNKPPQRKKTGKKMKRVLTSYRTTSDGLIHM